MKTFAISQLIIDGTFFINWDPSDKIEFIQSNCSSNYGDDILTYTFDFDLYTIYFNYNHERQTLENEHVEFYHHITESRDIKYTSLANFLAVFSTEIEGIYSDEDEDVLFSKSGVNVYFNAINGERVIQKITSKCDISRELVKSTLSPNPMSY